MDAFSDLHDRENKYIQDEHSTQIPICISEYPSGATWWNVSEKNEIVPKINLEFQN